MGKILKTCETIIKQIEEEGHEFENTLEILTPRIDVRVDPLNLLEEEAELKEYYGEAWDRRVEDEKYHYKKLEYSLLHAIREIKYFHKVGLENRKTVVLSTDCISSVQYIKREHYTTLVVHMRSSDVKALLPIDMLNLMKILRSVNDSEIESREGLVEDLTIIVGSAHIYTTGGRE